MTPTAKRALRIPTPPPFKNHGNEVVSVSALARFQQAQGRGGRRLRPHRDRGDAAARRRRPRASACARATRAAARTASRWATSSPAPTSPPSATVLAEGCWGHLTGAAIREFGLAEGREPQVWELGVKEVWKVPKPLDRADPHDRPVAAEALAEVRPDRRHVDLPDEEREGRGPRLDRLRRRPRVRRRDDVGPRPAAAVQAATRWSAGSSRAASASPGAPRRCPAAATGRCPS